MNADLGAPSRSIGGTCRVEETPFFFSLGEDWLFAVLHRPISRVARRGIVLCHALGEEKLWSHRVYVSFAREAASRGIAVLRFDFRGEGDSDLDFESSRLATRVADVLQAVEVLLELERGLRGCILLGHRLGCAVAAVAAARSSAQVEGLIAWDPIASGREYLMQWLRSTLASRLASTGEAPTRAALIKRLEAGETLVVDGYGIGPQLYSELIELEWSRLARALKCPALVIEGACEPPFWRETKRLYTRAPVLTQRSLHWLQPGPA